MLYWDDVGRKSLSHQQGSHAAWRVGRACMPIACAGLLVIQLPYLEVLTSSLLKPWMLRVDLRFSVRRLEVMVWGLEV